MGLTEMQLTFDNPWATYYSGSTVSGRLMVNLDQPKSVKEIKIKVKGEAQVSWTETEQYTDSQGKSQTRQVTFYSNEVYFEQTFKVFGGAGDMSEIPRGIHVYNFSVILPQNLPCSFEGEFGFVRYTVKGVLDRPWKFDQEAKAAFTVITPLDLNYIPEAKQSIVEQRDKYIGCCCCKSGPLAITLQVPTTGFVSGQNIPVTLVVENNTTTSVNSVKCSLTRVVLFKSRSPYTKTRPSVIDLSTVRLGTVATRDRSTVSENILVPALPPSNLHHCDIIDLSYVLKVETKVDGMFFRGLNFSVPIIFGTVPLAGDGGYQVGQNGPGWNLPSASSTFSSLPPPTYEQSQCAVATNIRDKEDSEHTWIDAGWAPRYPTYNFAPSAPPKT